MLETSARAPEEDWPPQPAHRIEHPSLHRSDVERVRIHADVPAWVTRQDTPPEKDSLWSFQLPETAKNEIQQLPVPMRLLQKAAKATQQPVAEVTIEWTTDTMFVAQASAARERLQACVEEKRKNLIASGSLRAEDAARLLPSSIAVAIVDARKHATATLPSVPSPK